MTSCPHCLTAAPDTSEILREEFLRWHYSHPEIYLKLKRIVLKEKAAGQESMEMSSLFDLYEESLVQDGRVEETVPRHYARFYHSLLAVNPYLWAFLKIRTVTDTEKSGG